VYSLLLTGIWRSTGTLFALQTRAIRRFREGGKMRMKPRVKKPVRSRHSTGVKKLLRSMRSMSTRTMTIAAIGAGGVAVMLAAVSSNVHPDSGAASAPANRSTTSAITAGTQSASLPELPPIESADKANAPKSAVTITGCLERDAESFRLKDTAGESAPKARSWKSGFLKKGRSSVEVIDASNRVKLPAHVGQRVSVTGTLVDREMQVRSLQRVAASCSVKS
jgi:hypothetical protein